MKTSYHPYILFFLGILLYANTITHKYALDDAIVIYDNMFTTEGLSGWSGILSNDTFFGFFRTEGKDQLVAGGRYRPLTLLWFAFLWELFGDSPFVFHLSNVLLYSGLCVLLYLTSRRMLRKKVNHPSFLSFIVVLLFCAHPLHTEVVANIKGADELFAMGGSIACLYFLLSAKKQKWGSYVAAFACYLMALLSKENAITFVAVFPLCFYFFSKKWERGHLVKSLIPIGAAILYLLIRFVVLGWDTAAGDAPSELLNNPFIKIEDGRYLPFSASERVGTILLSLLKYIILLIFPHPLVHDYYPRHIPITGMGSPMAILGLLMYLAMILAGLAGLRKKSILSFCLLFYLITLSISSNIIFPIGTNMSERFLFIPSFGFALAFGWILYRYLYMRKKVRLFWIILIPVLVLYSIKTVSRNPVWKDNYTLFIRDVRLAPKSAKLQNAAAGSILDRSIQDGLSGEALEQAADEAISHLQAALRIHPNYKNAHLLMGNAYFYKGNFDRAISFYNQSLRLDPNYQDALNNLFFSYRDGGRYYGEQAGDLEKSIRYLSEAYKIRKDDYELLRLLGVAHGFQRNTEEAIRYFTEATELSPQRADGWVNLGKAYFNHGDQQRGNQCIQKAREIDPEVKLN